MKATLTIAYIGGGSGFVKVLLHGIAGAARTLAGAGKKIDLRLMDVNLDAAGPNTRYAAIVRKSTGVDLVVSTTTNLQEAIDGADLVFFSAGVTPAIKPNRFLEPVGNMDGESGPRIATQMATLWPYLCHLGKEMRRCCPAACFVSIVNPTDVLAAAFQRKFGIQSVGLCVEIPNIQSWIAGELDVSFSDVVLVDYLGVNHFGYVSRWTVRGADGIPLLTEHLRRRIDSGNPPLDEELVGFFLMTGCLRTSVFHQWPIIKSDTNERRAQFERFVQHCRNAKDFFSEALERETMVVDLPFGPTQHTFGALVMGAATGNAPYVPLQVENRLSNPDLPALGWIEAPVSIRDGTWCCRSVESFPDWIRQMIGPFVHQRALIADWLLQEGPDALFKAMMVRAEPVTFCLLKRFCDELSDAVMKSCTR